MSESLADEIFATFGSDEDQKSNRITQDTVKEWMSSIDIDTLGALHAALQNTNNQKRIYPSLDFDNYQKFVLSYLGRCISENPDSEWASTRYEAGWEAVSWFLNLWRNTSAPHSALSRTKEWLESLYRSGDVTVRECIVNATLEHLFEKPEIAQYFIDWKNDSVLSAGYHQALDWSKKGGKSDLE